MSGCSAGDGGWHGAGSARPAVRRGRSGPRGIGWCCREPTARQRRTPRDLRILCGAQQPRRRCVCRDRRNVDASARPVLRSVSASADRSKIWIGCAAVLAAVGGSRGRQAAADGLASIVLTSAVVNLIVKPLSARRRPDRAAHNVPHARRVAMPRSTSFPSGHAASAFAFATGASADMPLAAIPLSTGAAVVAYSRVHTGVHYPSDVIAGSVIGRSQAPIAVALRRRRRARPGVVL